jgi:hypothetical protein
MRNAQARESSVIRLTGGLPNPGKARSVVGLPPLEVRSTEISARATTYLRVEAPPLSKQDEIATRTRPAFDPRYIRTAGKPD